MFVVRIVKDEDGATDFKAFEATHRVAAEARFRAAAVRVWSDDFVSAAMFYVTERIDPRAAIEAVKGGDPERVLLLRFEPERFDIAI